MTNVYLLKVSDLRSIAYLAAGHAVFGGLFDTGTYAPLVDVFGDPLTEVARICAEVDAGRGVLSARSAAESELSRDLLEREAGQGRLGIVFADDSRHDVPALVLFAGQDLPVMGTQPECDPARLRATLGEMTGNAPEDGTESLFTESSLDSSIFEERLNDRLRQLYGE